MVVDEGYPIDEDTTLPTTLISSLCLLLVNLIAVVRAHAFVLPMGNVRVDDERSLLR